MEKLLRLSEAKLKEDVFTVPQIRELFKMMRLHGKEKAAWNAFQLVTIFVLKKQQLQVVGGKPQGMQKPWLQQVTKDTFLSPLNSADKNTGTQ